MSIQQIQNEFKDVASVYQWQSPNITAPQVGVTPMQEEGGQIIDPSSGQVSSNLPQTTQQIAGQNVAQTPQEIQAALTETAKAGDQVENVFDKFQTAQGTIDSQSTVQGQMGNLMQQFEGGNTPAWAAGALRNANTMMARRGMATSSMAGAAATQAAMEAALPIAQQDAQTNFAMQMANLDNQQQTFLQKNQARTEALFTDIATENATRQFNASSQNQVRQFNANLKAQVEQFNANQLNAVEQFNAGQANAMSMFKAQMQDAREQFNAANRLVIDQANARWRQQIAMQNNATINEANRINAANLLATTLAEFNNISQARRDAVNFAFTASENAKGRAIELFLASMSTEEAERMRQERASVRSQEQSNAMWSSIGNVAARIFTGFFS